MKFKILLLALCLNFSLPAMADSDDVLGPFPAIGTEEEIKDINQLLDYQKIRTAAQCEAAQKEADASLETFFGKLLSSSELNTAHTKLRWLTIKAGVKILAQKQKFRRARPYITHPEIKPCIELENSKSYPSGHTTLARVYARVLSVMFPDRSAQFMNRADQVALNRVIGGVHHPSDIFAGKILGDAIADDYLNLNDSLYNLLAIH